MFPNIFLYFYVSRSSRLHYTLINMHNRKKGDCQPKKQWLSAQKKINLVVQVKKGSSKMGIHPCLMVCNAKTTQVKHYLQKPTRCIVTTVKKQPIKINDLQHSF